MSGEILYRAELREPEQARLALARGALPWVGEQLKAGRELLVEFRLLEDDRSIQRNKEYWGYVLRPISEQAQVNGMGTDQDGWHLYYKKMFLGYEFKMVRLPGAKRSTPVRKLRSTTDLSERKMRKYCEQVRAHAATTFGVTFPAMPMDSGAVRSRAPVDQTTGEILEPA